MLSRKRNQNQTTVVLQLTMCPQPKAKSFGLVKQIGQAYNQVGKYEKNNLVLSELERLKKKPMLIENTKKVC